MAAGQAPRALALPHGAPFARRSIEGFAHITDPQTVGRSLVLVGTRRARRVVEALADAAPAPRLLPRNELYELQADPLASGWRAAVSHAGEWMGVGTPELTAEAGRALAASA